MFKKILAAVDGSDASSRAVETAADLAKNVGASLVLAHVDERNIGKGGGPIQADAEEVRERVRKQAEDLSGQGVEASTEFRDAMLGGPAHALADIAKETGTELIVAGTRGHVPVSGLLLGSVTQRLLHIAPCPVLVVPPPD